MHDSWMSPKVMTAESAFHGRGIIAIERIEAGERLIVWGGPSYTDAHGAARARAEGRAVMQWDDDIFSCETDAPDWEEPFLINHSCDPNSWMEGPFTIVAMRDIGPGEEITVDYALWEFDETRGPSWVCRCGSSCCRGGVTGSDWKLPELRKKYAGHFSPLLNFEISRNKAVTLASK